MSKPLNSHPSKNSMKKKYTLYNNDCIEQMQKLAEKEVKADLILTDPPYGTTQCKWDNIIPFGDMWECIGNCTYDRTPVLLFGTQPFVSELVHSNIQNFKYNLIWDKHCVSNPFLAKKMPLKVHEEIMVFYRKPPYYNPQRVKQRHGGNNMRVSDADKKITKVSSELYSEGYRSHYYVDDGTRYPQTIISEYSSQMEECVNNKRFHPTQKPVALLEYLIRTYTKEDDLVLDFTMGSGSTGVACMNTGRKFIGIELEEKYYQIACERLKEASTNGKQTKLI